MTTADRERDRRSLQELARLAQLTPAPASVAPSGSHRASAARSDDDSGLVDLAAASLVDPQAAVRAQSTPLASAGLFDDVVPEAPVSYRPVSQPPPSRVPASLAPVPGSGVPAAPSVPSLVPGALASGPSIAPSQPPVARHSVPGTPGALLSQPALASQPAPTLAPPAPLSAPRVPALATASYAALVLPKKPSKRLVAAGVIGAIALVAGGIFAVRQAQQNAAAQAVAASSIEAPKRLKDEDIPLPEPTATENVAAQNAATAAVTEEPADEGTVLDPNALPEAQTTPVRHGTKAASKSVPQSVAQAATPKATTKAAATAKNDEAGKLTERDLPPSSGVVGALGDEMRKAVGDKGNDPSPAAGATGPQFAAGSVPQKPSQGAVTSAIGAVLPSARGCLGPDDPISRAAVVFGSAGTVESVRVSGGAAGKPAESCIQSALGKAKLAPFAEPTYTANITVRP